VKVSGIMYNRCKYLIAGSRATKGCKPRQVRKEATAAITDVCCG